MPTPCRLVALTLAILVMPAVTASVQSYLSAREPPMAGPQVERGSHWDAFGEDDGFRAGGGQYGTDVGGNHYPQSRSLGLRDDIDDTPLRPGAARNAPSAYGR